jgi:GH15 family glucan-1,4-alpha-glucosidase
MRLSPISNHALIGDCRTGALVSSNGSIDWLCLPHFSGPSWFAALLDSERGGHFSITPEDPYFSSRRYVGQSAVLETMFEGRSGAVRLIDAVIIGSSARNTEPMREIIRIIEGVRGTLALHVSYAPRPDYARASTQLKARGSDWVCAWGNEVLLLRSDHPLVPNNDGAGARLEVKAGDRLCFSLSYEKGDIAILVPLGGDAAERISSTALWWEGWSRECIYSGRHRDMVLRSAVTLKLMTFALSGAVVAAPTTSLPEWPGAGRNWDYRYCWLRDSALTMRAFTGLGLRAEAAAFLRWLLHATALTRPRLRVMYDVYGRSSLRESELEHLEGYASSQPVRIGNGASDQTQLDVYGGVIAAAVEFAENGGDLQKDQLDLLAGFGATVCRIWRQPDNGIWEIRDRKRQYVFSKLMCWVALDRLLALNRIHRLNIDVTSLERERAAIADQIETRGFNRDIGSYVGELDGDRVDAALLLMPCLGYGDPAGNRLKSSFDLIEKRLGRDGLIYRYLPDYDASGSPEGAFGICSFWAVENLARRGELDRAEERFRSLLGRANDLGLYAEEIEPDSGQALGNFPQAFTHVGLINAALAIEREKAAAARGTA